MFCKIFLFGLLIFGSSATAFSQEERAAPFADSRLPRSADAVEKFVPPGWTN